MFSADSQNFFTISNIVGAINAVVENIFFCTFFDYGWTDGGFRKLVWVLSSTCWRVVVKKNMVNLPLKSLFSSHRKNHNHLFPPFLKTLGFFSLQAEGISLKILRPLAPYHYLNPLLWLQDLYHFLLYLFKEKENPPLLAEAMVVDYWEDRFEQKYSSHSWLPLTLELVQAKMFSVYEKIPL